MKSSEFVVGWGTLALINAGLGQSKGHDGMSWFLLSLLFGPVATFLIVVSEPVARKRSAGRRDATAKSDDP